MAEVIQLPKGHIGVPASDDQTNTLVNRLILKLNQTKKNIYNKSHQNLKVILLNISLLIHEFQNIRQHVNQNTQLKYFKKLAGQATNSIQKVPKNLKKRIDSVLNHIGSMMASADPISQPTFYQSLVIAFIQKYPCEVCDKSNEDIQMPSFEAFYEHVLTLFKHSKEEDAGQEQQALALFFYEEVSKEIEDVDYHLMNDIILSSIAMTIDSALLKSHTRNQMYLTYKGFFKQASPQDTPLKAKKADDDRDDDRDDDSKLTKNVNASKGDAFDDEYDDVDDQKQARQSQQLDAEEESDKDMNNKNFQDLPEMPDIDNIQFESAKIPSQNVEIKFVPFTASLEEFTQRFEGEVIWDQLQDKIAPQTIAQACFEFYQIAQLNLSDIRAKKPQHQSMLSLRNQQNFIKSVFQQLLEQLNQIVQTSENKSLEFYQNGIKWLERQIIGSQQEGEQVVQAFNQKGQIQSISIASKKKRLSNLNQRVMNICLFSLGTLYQQVDEKVDFQKWNSYLTPYFESAKPYYHRAREFSLATYQRINQEVILPLNERVVVVISKGSAFFSVYIKQKMATSKLTEIVLEKFNSSRVVVNEQWMRLDFDNDGVVSVQDCKNTAKQAYKYLKQEKLIELKQSASSLYERSLQRIKSVKAKVMAIKQKSD